MYAFVRVFDEVRGFYGKNPFVAKFERDLESNGYLDDFKQQFKQKADKSWSEGRDEAVLWDDEICKAYAAVTDKPVQDSIIQRYEDTYTMTVSDFADDVNTWLSQQEPNRRILFLVDEVGQFIGENRELMLSLQSIAEDLAVKTNGRAWVVVTSQEDMDTIVGDRTKQQSYDFSKIQGRFAIKLKLNSADVVEVIQKRLLTKKPEYEPAMNELWNEQSANLRTMFEFTRETSKFSNNKAYDKDDFIASYPFVNYEFGLFQNALREMSRYNMFSGRHASVGERSMLSAISSALRSCKDETVGELVPFDRLYDGIADAIQSTSNFRINQAERNLDPDVRELGVRLLKVLLLIKHVDGIPATPHNLRILLTDRFDTDIMALEQNIKHALEALEHDTYVQRVGDTYNYLTNEETDLATSVAEKLKQESDKLKQLRARNANLGFIQQLDEPIEKITYASEKNVDWLLGDFILPETQNGSDNLLDLKEDVVDPIIAFLNGSQSKILIEGLKWLRSNELNIDYASGDAADLYQSVEQLANDPNIFRKINKFKPAMAELHEKMDSIVQSEQKSALESVEQIHTRIIDSDEYRNATPSAQTEVESELNRIAERVRNTTFISTMRKTVNELKNAIHPQLINKLSAAALEPQSALADDARIGVEEPAGDGIPEAWQAEPARVAVSFTAINRPRTKDALETTEDVDDFLDAYRRELIAAIRNGKKILL